MPELAEILDELNRAHRTADVIIERFTSWVADCDDAKQSEPSWVLVWVYDIHRLSNSLSTKLNSIYEMIG
jgi:hypothetical protein